MINDVFAAFDRFWPHLWLSRFRGSSGTWDDYAEERLKQTKRAWFRDLPEWVGENAIKRGLSKAHTECEAPPSFSRFVRLCAVTPGDVGVPDYDAAYEEACRAYPPRENYPWTHIAIYYAGVRTGWFELRTMTRKEVFLNFKSRYLEVLKEMDNGVVFPHPSTMRIGNGEQNKESLSREQSLEKLDQLRAALEL